MKQALFFYIFLIFVHKNMTDVETLRKAQEHPEEYPNLLVRVGGYSARFNRLNRELQNDIICRLRHTH
ncbi:MAG: hypothetical protein II333_11005 [Clostridia bacterium]|nr:hypothetical protein [Clostridia bacterium]